jgi:hypothetical protein
VQKKKVDGMEMLRRLRGGRLTIEMKVARTDALKKRQHSSDHFFFGLY